MTTAKPKDRLILHARPLHTEKKIWAKYAPDQVEAACELNPHIAGFTETRGSQMAKCRSIAEDHGYRWIGHPVDVHRNVSLVVRHDIKITHQGATLVGNNWRPEVTFDWFGRDATVFGMHFEPDQKVSALQAASLIQAMKRRGLAYYLADSNPNKPQRMRSSQPGAALLKAGMPTIFQELHHWPADIGVTMIGQKKHRASVAVDVKTGNPLKSDHVPATGFYDTLRKAS